ncbi:MAG: hypothetical protein J5787_07170 [Alphaproteobacteria bacterium]|nr:hypothetical protein [Alphaproteobacteria bacterium]
MALTKQDIETAIGQTEHQDVIRHSLSNYFEGLDQPVAVAIAVNETGVRGWVNEGNIETIVNALRAKGIDAVSMMDPEASRPDKYVVNGNGIQTPFLSPEDALKATTCIEEVCCDAGFKLSGHANVQTNDTMLYAARENALGANKQIDLAKAHPDSEKFDEIVQRNGGDLQAFIDTMINEAVANSETVVEKDVDTENAIEGYAHLWRGATLGGKPYAAIFASNDRKVAYASPHLTVSAGYSGYGESCSGVGGATYPQTTDGQGYGFLYSFDSLGDDQIYYTDMGLQSAAGGTRGGVKDVIETTEKLDGTRDFETGIFSYKNKLNAIYLHLGRVGEDGKYTAGYGRAVDRVFKIELDENGQAKDPRWRDFLALHEPTDSTVFGHMAERQNAQKREQDNDPGHCYQFRLEKDLEPKDYGKQHFSAREYAESFVLKSEIEQQGDTVVIKKDLKVPTLDHKDLSGAHVDGSVAFFWRNQITDLGKLPTTRDGMYNFNFSGDLSSMTMETFLAKVKGTEWVSKYTHRAEDGHLVVDGEGGRLDFEQMQVDRRWNGDGKLKPTCKMEPISLPKDALNVEFNCEVANPAFKKLLFEETMGFPVREALTMVDKMAFRASSLNRSDAYYKPDEKESELTRKLAAMTKAAIKAAGVDYRSEEAKELRLLALADYARTPEGQKDIAALRDASKNMEKFDKAPTLMQTLQSQFPKQTVQNKLMQINPLPKKAPIAPVQKGKEI